MNELHQAIFAGLKRIVDKIIFLGKRKMFEFQGKAFYPSEVHLLLALKEFGTTNTTRIAESLGITKGAISQTVTRLVAKDVLSKTRDTANKNELTLHFTSFGRDALAHYEHLVQALTAKHAEILARFTDQEQHAIRRYLQEVDTIILANE
ncbi:MAG: MarR family transcriptional regulator [Desulfovibrio sp.]|nr:MAG: MarR family transcriptional regulator [Desulfovibrio sp.]